MTKIFEATVLAVGPEAPGMITDANMLILFGEEAPDDLAEYCYKIDNKNVTGPIQVGGRLVVDGVNCAITAVGNVVEKNLQGLGHITVSLDGSEQGSLPGTLHVAPQTEIKLKEGSVIQLFDS
ncbi:PTS sorbitol transporter subunit IIA [Streptococcus chenjunshii]|uniref:PTS sorbitol transporter subunit IIA n=1 Tax=Streptococcus chenjunshii TaxID=2173853 RepID=A0A372KPD5_9STRE|nr:PTS glucitol/sorbitol transporter subunit IIA [Streptococcus chenjunshii]AXQ77841.1 PTS sorbitol transporter subunit IIA [Streptococcus chenjunshii]RFU51352.1 PTS sorbitol transporter subunit IIA [Streptococcus chenjunshii]RFU53774.1 PTS sorbitol transporter subunit IIA [Streptococcus chenjunshii]